MHVIPFPSHLRQRGKPQAVLKRVPKYLKMLGQDKAKQQRHG